MKTVYLETSFVSYLVSEPGRDVIVAGHQAITREWWAHRRRLFACYVSQEVLDEAGQGDAGQVVKRLAIAQALPKLPITPAVTRLAGAIVQAGAMPRKAARDAVHVAVAAVATVDYVLTWNCKHIANREVLPRIEKVVQAQGWKMPAICTPEELMGEDWTGGELK
jgi:hypothetical protein